MIKLTRTDTSAEIVLHRDLLWTDRHDWSTVVDVEERTVTGALIVEPWERAGGRPITLASESSEFGLVTRSVVESLAAWQAVPGLEMTLNYHGESYDVMFRLGDDGGAVRASPVFQAGPPAAGDLMMLTLRLRTR